jgi:adenylate cyclase
MRFRIGIHLGDVIQKPDGSIYGDGVNIAARLEGLAEPGGIAVSESIRTAVKGKVETGFEDLGEQVVKNIADPVRVYRLSSSVDGKPKRAEKMTTDIGVDLSLPDRPSVAVLAFTNMSGDPEQESFTDGITEDIITELSRFDSLFVIARNSSFTYKGKPVDVKRVGLELGVRYVVEGSIRRLGNRVRVTAQLIDTSNGSHIWADRYDREVQDIFAVQEEVTECIVATIAPQVNVAESLRARRRPGNLTAYELAVRATSLILQAQVRSDAAQIAEGLHIARQALAIDPESLPALHAVAYAQFQSLLLRSAKDRTQVWKEGMEAASRGVELAQSARSHALKGLLLAHEPTGGKLSEAQYEAETAYRLNPQDSSVIFIYAQILIFTEAPVQAIDLLKRALRINPRDPMVYNLYSGLTQAHIILGDYVGGLEWGNRARAAAPQYVHAHLLMAMLYAGLENSDKAAAALEDARRVAPELVQRRLAVALPVEGKRTGRQFDVLLRKAARFAD